MELEAIRRAAILHFMRLELVNPKHKAIDVIGRLAAKYGFTELPSAFLDKDQSGIAFGNGRFGGYIIEEVRFFRDGILVSTGESTDLAGILFTDLMETFVEMGGEFRPELVTSVKYVSQLVVRSPMDLVGRGLSGVNDLLARTFPDNQPTGFSELAFFTNGNVNEPSIRIDRLANMPPDVTDHYWTQAPLPTWEHFKFLQDFEALFL